MGRYRDSTRSLISPLGTARTKTPSWKSVGRIPDSQSCQVVSETCSRKDPVHFVQRSAAWFTVVPIAPSPPSASSHYVRNEPRYG